MTRRRAVPSAAAVEIVLAATIAGVFIFQAVGYPPCELCLKERWPYYIGLVLGAFTLVAAWRGMRGETRLGFALIAILMMGSALFGAWHAGIEWGFWPGPTDCTGSLERASSNADFLHQLQTVHVVRCDAVAIRILGLSLAGWNAVVSLGVAFIAARGFLQNAKA